MTCGLLGGAAARNSATARAAVRPEERIAVGDDGGRAVSRLDPGPPGPDPAPGTHDVRT